MKTLLLAAIVTFFVVAECAVVEAAFRCPNGNLVDTGDGIAVVSVKCDPPASISKRSEPVETERGRVKYNEIQEWVYTAGSTLMHILTFQNGVLVSISTGGFSK